MFNFATPRNGLTRSTLGARHFRREHFATLAGAVTPKSQRHPEPTATTDEASRLTQLVHFPARVLPAAAGTIDEPFNVHGRQSRHGSHQLTGGRRHLTQCGRCGKRARQFGLRSGKDPHRRP